MKYLIAVLMMLVSLSVSAELTASQRATLKADVQADPVLGALEPSSDAINQIIAAYALDGSPACVVWRTSVPASDYREAIVWTEVDGLNAGDARTFEWLTEGLRAPLDASKANVRQGIADAWAANTGTRANLLVVAKRNANRLEKLFAAGACTTGNPATMVVEGRLSYQDVLQAMGW